MKKMIAAIICLTVMLLAFSSCASDDTQPPTDTESTRATEDTDNATNKATESTEKGKEEVGMDSIKILAIGNSFSEDTMEYAYYIAKHAGVKRVVLGNLVIGGCSLATHAKNAREDAAAYTYHYTKNGIWTTTEKNKLSDVLSSESWDFISLQQVSGDSGNPNSYAELPYLIDYIRSTAGKTPELVWNMTWSYQQDTTHGAFAAYEKDQLTMYQRILDTVAGKILPNDEISIVSPTGTAIQNARTSFVGDTLTRDGFHLSFGLGRYTAALTFIHQITGLPIDEVGYKPEGVSEAEKAIAIESAKNAVKTPFDITESKFTEKTPEEN